MLKSVHSQSEDSSQILEENSKDIGRNYDQQFEELERNITSLKLENEELQRRIAIIYEFKKNNTNEEKVYNKDTNINDVMFLSSSSNCWS